MASNGFIPRSQLEPITRAANGEQAYLRADAARAFKAMNAESERRFGVTLRVASARTAYRPYRDQLYFWNLYVSGRGNLAARPGTSNHGWGIAVDISTGRMRQIIDQIGAKYGWAKRWSDAPSEWWHIRYRPGVWKGQVHKPDRLAHMKADEKRLIKEWLALKAARKNKARRGVIFRWLIERRKNIFRAAQKDGWNKLNRRKRWATLKRITDA
jgi:D-alanyl-D-alanine dipeptidase